MENYKKTIGNFGEEETVKYLRKKGYKILECNFNVRGGEIDIIAHKNGYVVFVEVKTRKDDQLGSGAEAVTYTKRQKIIKAAQYYLLKVGECDVRFDVVEVIGNIENGMFKLQKLNHIENAF